MEIIRVKLGIINIRMLESSATVMTHLFSHRWQRQDEEGGHLVLRNSVQKLFERLRDKVLPGLPWFSPWPASKLFHWWPAGRKWGTTEHILQDFNRSITLIADTDALIASIVARIKELFDTDRVILLHSYPESGMFSLAYSLGYDATALKGLHLTEQDRLAKWLLTNETALIPDRDPGVLSYLSAAEREMLERLDVRVCVPLLALNRLTGLMLLSSTRKEWCLSDEDLKTLQALLSQAGIAYENAYLSQLQRDRIRRLYRAERLATAGQLAASVAHEIRNPLTSIRSTVQYLLGEFDHNHPKRALVEGIISEVDRIDRTVDGLLGLTRRTQFAPRKISLADLIGQSLLLVRTQAQKQSIEILWDTPPQGVDVLADEAQLKQLALNLLMNAMQAMPNGGRLEVSLGAEPELLPSPERSNFALMSIADTGCGIPAENLDNVFDPFFTTKPGGTGLGLSTCYAIVRQHGGDLEIRSQENKGTRVIVRLPLAG